MCKNIERPVSRFSRLPASLSRQEARTLYLRLRRRLRLAEANETSPPTLSGDRTRIRAARCREIRFGRDGSWLYDANRLIALHQAETLLDRVLGAGE